MAKAEHPEKYDWWLNELDSFGISTLQKNGLDSQKEASDLTEAVKQTLYEEYLQAYDETSHNRQCPLVVISHIPYHLKYQKAVFLPYYLKDTQPLILLNRERQNHPYLEKPQVRSTQLPPIIEPTPCGITSLGLLPTTTCVLKVLNLSCPFLP
jgi:hypothetical protein